MPRLFIAIPLPEHVRDHLSSLGGGVAGARWLDYDQLHLTLVFIGEVDGSRSPSLFGHLGRVDFEAFTLNIRDVGHFPSRGAPRVLWAGTTRPTALLRLQDALLKAVKSAGVELKRRKFRPHVTIARLNHPDEEEVATFLAGQSALDLGDFTVDRFEVWQSHLAPGGASYSVVQRFKAQSRGRGATALKPSK